MPPSITLSKATLLNCGAHDKPWRIRAPMCLGARAKAAGTSEVPPSILSHLPLLPCHGLHAAGLDVSLLSPREGPSDVLFWTIPQAPVTSVCG